MKKIIKTLVLLFLPLFTKAGDFELQEFTNGFFESGVKGAIVKHDTQYNGKKYEYYSYKSNENGNYDLYVFLHGEYAKTKSFFNTTGLHSSLKKHGSFISFDSPHKNWHESKNSAKDTTDVILHVLREYINALRYRNVYFIGYSGGGTLVTELLCDSRFTFIKGVVNVGGSVHGDSVDDCNLNKKIFPYLYVYGDKNSYYGYENKDIQNNQVIMPPNNSLVFLDAENKLAKILKCKNPSSIGVSDNDISDMSSIIQRDYVCMDGDRNQFRVLRLQNFDKNWLGNEENKSLDFIGNPNRDLLFNKYIFKFLKFN
jgi:predicted esterase